MTKILAYVVLLALVLPQDIQARTHALSHGETLPTRIVRAYDKNILVLNRGIEDAITKGEHIKLTNNHGFIARGICIKSETEHSHWKIYRVTRPELVSKDSAYTLVVINQSQIPKDLQRFKEVDFSEYLPDVDNERQLELQQERIAQYDLPETIQDAKDFNMLGVTKKESRIEEKTQTGDFFDELKKLKLSFFASPMVWETLNNQRNHYFGVQAENKGDQYDIEMGLEQRESRFVNRYSKEDYEQLYRRLEIGLHFKNTDSKWFYSSYAIYEQETQGSVTNPQMQLNIAPIGLTRNFYYTDKKQLSFSFLPMYDTRQYQKIDGSNHSKTGVRLGMHLKGSFTLGENTKFHLDYWHSPYLDLSQTDLDLADNRSNFKNILAYELNENFSLEYQLQYFNDITYRRDLDVQGENVVNMINLRFTTQL